MKKIIKFLDKIHREKNKSFNKDIEQYVKLHEGTDYFNGSKLEISGQRDVFIYFSNDKKKLSISWDEFDPTIQFSYLIYFSFFLHCANYVNGGLRFLGFYDKNYLKVKKIPINSFDIIKCDTGCNFDEKKRPKIRFELCHKYGNKHYCLRGDVNNTSTCQKALDFIWELDNFYSDIYNRLVESPVY